MSVYDLQSKEIFSALVRHYICQNSGLSDQLKVTDLHCMQFKEGNSDQPWTQSQFLEQLPGQETLMIFTFLMLLGCIVSME